MIYMLYNCHILYSWLLSQRKWKKWETVGSDFDKVAVTCHMSLKTVNQITPDPTKLIKTHSKVVIAKYRCVRELPGICKCHINPQIDTTPCHNCIKHIPRQHFTCRFLSLIHELISLIFIAFVNSRRFRESMFYAWEMLRMDWPGNLMLE